MRKLWSAAIMLVVVAVSSCHHRWGNSSSIIINSDGLTEEVRYTGEIRFSDDETTVSSISPGGFVVYKKNNDRIEIENNHHGEVIYQINGGDRTSTLDPEGKRILADAIREMINLGFDAERRMHRIYDAGGNRALLKEVDQLKSDDVKKLYLEEVLKDDSLSNYETALVAKKIRYALGSDDDKSNLLAKFNNVQLTDSVTRVAWLAAVESIGSDDDKANALRNALTEKEFAALLPQTLKVINSIGSDDDKANLLTDLLKKQGRETDQYDLVFRTIENIGSDDDKKNVLFELVNARKLSKEEFQGLMKCVRNIGSDDDKSAILDHVIDQRNLPAESLDELVGCIESIGSDDNKVNLYRKITDMQPTAEAEWESLLHAVEKIPADDQKANVLVEIATKMPKTDHLRSVFIRCAKSINSDPDYGRTIRAIE